jgi:uncharacterized protein (TIGR04222 family)
MNPVQAELWQRIEAFRIGESPSALTFVQRLARDNRWTLEYAWRVHNEYKRFAFLSVVAEHPVTPSEDVDEAWHLHLLYTRSYWDDFCPRVLGRVLHHEPTRGGSAEHEKHSDWYRRTLDSYNRFFGPPPGDIWPTAEIRFSDEHARLHVETARFWIVPRPQLNFGSKLTLGALALVALGCAPVLADIENPLDMRGPDFLILYLVALIATIGFASALRWLLRAPGATANTANSRKYHPYELAWLVGGWQRALDAALANLVASGFLKLNLAERNLEVLKALPPDSHVLEREIFKAAQADGSLAVVRSVTNSIDFSWAQKLSDEGLLLSAARKRVVQWVPTLLLVAVLVLGITKINIGINRGKPTDYLSVLVLITFAITAVFGLRSARLSRLGERIVADAKNQNASLRNLNSSSAEISGVQSAIAVALFGSVVLADGPWKDLQIALTPPASGWTGATGVGCGGGFGGGGCGGGHGCGGCSGH